MLSKTPQLETFTFPDANSWPPPPTMFTPTPSNAGVWVAPDRVQFDSTNQLANLQYLQTLTMDDISFSARMRTHNGNGSPQGAFGFTYVSAFQGSCTFSILLDVPGACTVALTDPFAITHQSAPTTFQDEDVFSFFVTSNPTAGTTTQTIQHNGLVLLQITTVVGPWTPGTNTFTWGFFASETPVVNPWTIDIGDLTGFVFSTINPAVKMGAPMTVSPIEVVPRESWGKGVF